MPTAAGPKLKYHNRSKVLLCYALVWGVALLLPYLGLRFVYPYKLASTAPDLTAALARLPFTLPAAVGQAMAAALPEGLSTGALQAALAARDLIWRYWVGAFALLAWAASLLWQLLWRARYVRPKQAARAALRAVRGYRFSMLGIWAVNLLAALIVYLTGVSRIPGRTLWDYLMYFNSFLLNPAAAALCFRLAAPPAISGRRAFFHRL